MIPHLCDRSPRIQSLPTRLLVAALILTPWLACAKDVNALSSTGSRSWADMQPRDGENRWLNAKGRDETAPGSFLHGAAHGRSPSSDNERDASEVRSTVSIPIAFFDANASYQVGNRSQPVPVTAVPESVTAVPEPQTYVLLLAGLGAMAWVIRRQRRRD